MSLMEMFIRIGCMVAMVGMISCKECVDSKCFTTNSSDTRNGVTINYGCQRTGRRLYQCSLSIMGKSTRNKHQSDCVDLSNVPGIHQFCKSHVLGLQGPPAPPAIQDNHDDEDDTVTENPDDKPITYETEYITCIEIEVLVGVAVGSFVLGSFVTWAVITILAQCKNLQKELRDVQSSNSIRSIGRPRINYDMNSTSAHQRLLSNASAESCPSTNLSGQHSGPARRQSEDEGGSGRQFQMRQPLPAPPVNEATLQPYYAQPVDSLYACASDKDYQSIQGGSEHYAPVGEDSTVRGASHPSRDAGPFYARPIDSLYTSTSDKDYQSLQGGSEHYAPISEGGDYTSLKSNHNTGLQTNSASEPDGGNGGGNDYCSLESECGDPDEAAIYYPVSDSSNRDYTDLIGDGDSETYSGVNHHNESTTTAGQNGDNSIVKFQVNGFAGFSDPKRLDISVPPEMGQVDIIPKVRNGLDARGEDLTSPSEKSTKKQARLNKEADGYEMIPSQKSTEVGKDGSHDTLAGSVKNVQTGNDVIHPGNSTGSVNTHCYAGVDFHDYETCNGSIHEYFILEETATSV